LFDEGVKVNLVPSAEPELAMVRVPKETGPVELVNVRIESAEVIALFMITVHLVSVAALGTGTSIESAVEMSSI